MVLLDDKIWFPPTDSADETGIVAIGGDLSTERLLLAYRNGIFPWYNEDEPIIWWSPDPRFVLLPNQLIVSRSMQGILRSGKFTFTINQAFEEVMQQCKTITRNGQNGTWITEAIQKAYTNLHSLGYAYSAEAWCGNELVGGLYGVRMGKIFFGESMFSKISNASKFAFIKYTEQLEKEGVLLIDCQVYTQHLESLGACMISRKNFLAIIKNAIA